MKRSAVWQRCGFAICGVTLSLSLASSAAAQDIAELRQQHQDANAALGKRFAEVAKAESSPRAKPGDDPSTEVLRNKTREDLKKLMAIETQIRWARVESARKRLDAVEDRIEKDELDIESRLESRWQRQLAEAKRPAASYAKPNRSGPVPTLGPAAATINGPTPWPAEPANAFPTVTDAALPGVSMNVPAQSPFVPFNLTKPSELHAKLQSEMEVVQHHEKAVAAFKKQKEDGQWTRDSAVPDSQRNLEQARRRLRIVQGELSTIITVLESNLLASKLETEQAAVELLRVETLMKRGAAPAHEVRAAELKLEKARADVLKQEAILALYKSIDDELDPVDAEAKNSSP